MNTNEFPGQITGAAPTWAEAFEFEGGRQIGVGGRLLVTLDWPTLTPRHELVAPHQTPGQRLAAYAGEFADGSRLVYQPSSALTADKSPLRLTELGGAPWTCLHLNPRTGEHTVGPVIVPEPDGTAPAPRPTPEDWLLLLRRSEGAATP